MEKLSEMLQEWKASSGTSIRITAFGSSNTELSWHSGGRHNWVDWLNINIREHIGRHVTIINQGICGDTAEGLLTRIGRDVLSFEPKAAIITIGGNDSIKGYSSEVFETNVRELCSKMIEKNIKPVLQTYYCPLYDEFPKDFRKVFESFMEVNRKISKDFNIPIIDYYSYFEPFYTIDRSGYKKLMLDGLHVNYIGNLIMGIIASQNFGLPDLKIPENIYDEVSTAYGKMKDYYKTAKIKYK
jgi:lysophospholipase L1-like esterase